MVDAVVLFVFCSVCELSIFLFVFCSVCELSILLWVRRVCLSTFMCGSLCAFATAHSLQNESFRYLGKKGQTILR